MRREGRREGMGRRSEGTYTLSVLFTFSTVLTFVCCLGGALRAVTGRAALWRPSADDAST